MNYNWDSYDCYKENIWDKERFFKEHKKERIGKSILELYHTLHHSLSNQSKEVYFWDAILENKKIEKRKIQILDLDPKGVYEATHIQDRKDIIITNPKYIPGKVLQDYEHELGKERIQMICNAITRDIEMKTKLKFIDMYGVTSNNVKIHINENIAELIVTDISCNIRSLFYTWKNAIILDNIQKENI